MESNDATSLVFAGDMAWPAPDVLDCAALRAALAGAAVVVNLEGPLIDAAPEGCAVHNEHKFNLYSHGSVVPTLQQLNVVACGLANNHISDYVGGVARSKAALAQAGIQAFGTRESPHCVLQWGGRQLVLVGACSPLPEPLDERGADAALVFDPPALLALVKRLRQDYPAARLVAFMHWGYELARYPQPADREWARRAVEAGADYVIGHHPHLVQGLERHGAGVIAYSLGNFLLPQVAYRGRVLRYKTDAVGEQLLLALTGEGLQAHWWRYLPAEGRLADEGGGPAEDDARLKARTPFAGMDDAAYRRWFAAEGQFGTELGRRAGPTLWSYRGWGRVETGLKFGLLGLKRRVRKLAIAAGVHKPYNW